MSVGTAFSRTSDFAACRLNTIGVAVFLILIGGFWALLWIQVFPALFPLSLEFRVIGWVIPGLIAGHFDRQGVTVTTASLVTVTVVLHFLGRIFSL